MKKMMTILAALLSLSMFMSAMAYDHNWKFVAAGDASTYAIDQDGSLWGWGWNESGQLGLGSGSDERTATPVQISTEKWTMAAAGKAYAFFLKEDGTLWAAGDNSKGVQGTGDGTAHKTLTQIGTDSDWKYVNTTRFFGYSAFAIKTDGTLWAWGEGEMCALGLGNFSNKPTPTQVGTDTDWTAVTVGAAHGMGLKSDGSLWMWGWNERGQLADMTDGTGSLFVKRPQQYGEDTDWVKVFAVGYCSYAIKADGTLWAWGDNQDDLLFGYQSNDTTSIKTPRKITSIEGKVTHISGCENTRIVAVGENGVATKVYAWGSNYDGALGDGKGSSLDLALDPKSYSPVEVKLKAGLKFTQLASGQFYSNVLTDEGRIYAWGKNRGGQLGNFVELNQMTFASSPILSAEVETDAEGVFTFDAQNIPSALSTAKKLVLTGEWSTYDFQMLTASIGNNAGLPPAGNASIEEVDMSQATIASSTTFYVPQGLQTYGLFNGCKSLATFKMPAAEQAANFKSLRSAFQNNAALTSIDLSGCVNVTSIEDAFYGCASLTEVDLSACNKITSSISAFDKCTSLETIKLPAKITIGKFMFGDCTALTTIDWSLFEGEVPSFAAGVFSDVFQYVEDLKAITLLVPAEAYEAFANHADWSRLNVQKVGGAEEEPVEGEYVFDAANIPSLADAVIIRLTGAWGSSDFQALTTTLGNNAGFPAAGNDLLQVVDMSQATILEGTSLNVSAGFSTAGVFSACRALTTVIMPNAENAANFTKFKQAFQNCSALAEIDLSNCSGLTTIEDAFLNCASLESVDLSSSSALTTTTSAFKGCEKLATVKLPSVFKFSSNLFNDCFALSEIDWSLYQGTEAPTYVASAFDAFDYTLSDITIKVPSAAYAAFLADSKWSKFNIVEVTGDYTGVEKVETENVARVVYNIKGQYITTLAPGVGVEVLPKGLYIVGGEKIFKR